MARAKTKPKSKSKPAAKKPRPTKAVKRAASKQPTPSPSVVPSTPPPVNSPLIRWESGDRVQHEIDGQLYGGTVAKHFGNGKVRVTFDDGDVLDVPEGEVESYNEYAFTNQKGFNNYGVSWADGAYKPIDHNAPDFDWTTVVNFKFTADDYDGIGVAFHGSWRKTVAGTSAGENVFCIDIWAKRNDELFTCESIPYFGEDPRQDIRSLNADIGAAVSKWFFHRLGGNVAHLDDLIKRSRYPAIRITRLETMDRLILKLKECRDTACYSGGQRSVEIIGDKEGDPSVRVFIDITSVAMALEGKVPSLYEGAVYDDLKGGGKKTARSTKGDVLKPTPSADNVQVLVAKLEEFRAAGNKGEARRIRAVLRKMGHKGGARSVKAPAPAPPPPALPVKPSKVRKAKAS